MKRATAIGWLKHDVTNRGITAWLLSGLLLGFYVLLYFGHIIAKFYTTKTVKGQQIVERVGWPVLHNIVFAVILVLVVTGGIMAFLREKEEPEGGKHILYFTAGGVLLTLAMYVLPDIYHLMGLTGQPFSQFAKDIGLPGKWMLYGLIYSIAITSGGLYVIWKYKHNKYQIVRTSVVIFVQIVFGFSIPWIMKMIKQPDYYFSYIWPLKTSYFYPSTIAYQFKAGLPVPIIAYSFIAGLIVAPLLAVIFGKRWYCSWVCGCGGLANTFGEPWRHLSDKSTNAWKLEKWTIHFFLLLTLLVTGMALLAGLLPTKAALQAQGVSGDQLKYLVGAVKGFQSFDMQLRDFYGVVAVSLLSGIVGVGLYPLGGTRVWCRFACPMAALLGLAQKFGRFRIRVKRDMCISCGMCSKYCEMGIDVRSYAQANQSFTRASCVGCGLCSEVCPRGVLRLENVLKQDAQELFRKPTIEESWKGEQSSVKWRS